ncbi:MAG TPA: hypothetical protein VK138_16175 [Acidiferrobacterales bacterium]|nr:hypothetical protein [Acidiferrobacterales bacterium]
MVAAATAVWVVAIRAGTPRVRLAAATVVGMVAIRVGMPRVLLAAAKRVPLAAPARVTAPTCMETHQCIKAR